MTKSMCKPLNISAHALKKYLYHIYKYNNVMLCLKIRYIGFAIIICFKVKRAEYYFFIFK